MDVAQFTSGASSSISSRAIQLTTSRLNASNIHINGIKNPFGPVYVGEDSHASFSMAEFLSNNGSSLVVEDSEVVVEDSEFYGGFSENGGAIFGQNATITVIRVMLDDNVYEKKGGAVYLLNSTMSMHHCSVRRNLPVYPDIHSFGGGIYASNSILEVIDTPIQSNQAYIGGGAYIDNSTLIMGNGNVVTNTADAEGARNSVLRLIYSEISLNYITHTSSTSHGGGIYIYNSTFEGDAITANNNSAAKGSCLLAIDSTLSISNFHMVLNSGRESVIDVTSSEVNLRSGEISNHTSTKGVLVSLSSKVVLSEMTFQNNDVTNNGGAITGVYSSFEMVGVAFLGNKAAYYGGAVALEGSSFYADYIRFISNSASVCGALFSLAGTNSIHFIYLICCSF